jgi:hypothetical protein
MGWMAEVMSFSPGRGKIFLFSTSSRRVLGPTQPPIQWVPGVTRQERGAYHTPPSSTAVKNGEAILPLPIRLHGIVLNELSTGTTLPITTAKLDASLLESESAHFIQMHFR